jgi:hypothetical protein
MLFLRNAAHEHYIEYRNFCISTFYVNRFTMQINMIEFNTILSITIFSSIKLNRNCNCELNAKTGEITGGKSYLSHLPRKIADAEDKFIRPGKVCE